MSSPLIDDLRAVVGAAHVLTGELAAGFERDWTDRFGGPARAVVRPADRSEIESVLSICRREQAPVIPQGGNTGLVGGSVPRSAATGHDGPVVISTGRLTGIGHLDPVSGQIEVQAGVTLAALQDALRGSGWRFGVDLGARDRATIGGMIATNAGGLHVVAHGMMRRQILGIEAVLATGRVLRRLDGLAKDNTGYDLVGLLCGSEGTLAMVTAARVRLIHEPAERVVALLGVASIDDAVSLSGRLRRCDGVEAIEVFGADEAELAAAHGNLDRPFRPWPPVMVLAEAAGSDPATRLHQAVAAHDAVLEVAVATTPAASRNLWAIRELITDALLPLGPVLKLDVTLPTAGVPTFLSALQPLVTAQEPTARVWVFGHLADGNLHLNLTDHATDEAAERALTDTILTLVAEHHGSISAEHGIGVAKRPWLHLSRSGDELATMKAIKDALDPDHLMNPGVLLPERS
ncbi:MAG: FAD-binding oxidoreductase [Acidimicrobiales bacterium]